MAKKKILFTDEQELEIIDLYTNKKLSTPKIGEIYGVRYTYIINILEKHGIKRVNNGKRKYYLNEHYFDNIDTPNKAYILGFFYADGCNFPKKQTISMSLQDIDRDILEKIRLEIGSDKELEFINQSKRKDKDNDYNYCDMWRLLLFSSHMCKTLDEKGMTPKKSLTLTFPTWLDQDLYPHFIRGYFDGDGCITYKVREKEGLRTLVSFTSTEEFCVCVQHILQAKIGINGGIYDASSHNGITKVLSISGSNQVRLLMNWLYEDADLYMQRKYDKYIELLNVIQNKSQVA